MSLIMFTVYYIRTFLFKWNSYSCNFAIITRSDVEKATYLDIIILFSCFSQCTLSMVFPIASSSCFICI